MSKIDSEIRKKLGLWFDIYRRKLPWRLDKDPYKIWLSEIIMQQTRVAQGTPYYQRFIEKYPNVKTLASAPEQEVLRLWQGLGYYSRARNLHHTAKQIEKIFNGVFPNDYKELLSLKGIGKYTASAIISLAYNKPFAVLDGNVYRVISRLYGIETPVNAPEAEKIYSEIAQNLLDKKAPGRFNEAMMEFGALQCVPQNPNCAICPLTNCCIAWQTGKVGMLPIKTPKKAPVSRRINYLFTFTNEGLYLKQRPAGDIWQSLYDMPEIKGETDEETILNISKDFGFDMKDIIKITQMKHQLTHQSLQILIYNIKVKKTNNTALKAYIFIKFNNLNDYPLPRPVEKFLKDYI